MAEKTYTARQVASRFNVAGSTVRGWLLRGLLAGAYLQKTGLGDSYWLVPASALKNFVPPKPGPVPKTADSRKRATGQKRARNGPSSRKGSKK